MDRGSSPSWFPGATFHSKLALKSLNNIHYDHGGSTTEGTMFFRTKKSGSRTYLQVVENRWENGRSRQRVVATLGRLDQLQESGQLDALLASGARLAQSVLLLSAHAQGRATRHHDPAHRPGPDLPTALAANWLPARHQATSDATTLRV